MKYVLGLFLAVVALFWYFIVEFIRCAAITSGDSFYFDLAMLLLLFLLAGLSVSYALVKSFAKSKDVAKIVLASAIAGCAFLSFWFRYELVFLADKAFFLKNQTELEDRATGDVAVVKQVGIADVVLIGHRRNSHVGEGTSLRP